MSSLRSPCHASNSVRQDSIVVRLLVVVFPPVLRPFRRVSFVGPKCQKSKTQRRHLRKPTYLCFQAARVAAAHHTTSERPNPLSCFPSQAIAQVSWPNMPSLVIGVVQRVELTCLVLEHRTHRRCPKKQPEHAFIQALPLFQAQSRTTFLLGQYSAFLSLCLAPQRTNMASSLGQGRRSSALLSTLTNPRSNPMVRTDSSTSATAIEDFQDAENATRYCGGVDAIEGPPPNPSDGNITFISPFASAGASQPVPIPPAFQAQKQQKPQASSAAAAQHHLSPVSPSSISFAKKENATDYRRASLAPLSESRRRSAMPPQHFPSTHSPATTAFLMDPANEERRRNSVDVAALSSAQDYRTIRKGTKRVRAARDSDHYDPQDSDGDPAENSFQDQSRVSMWVFAHAIFFSDDCIADHFCWIWLCSYRFADHLTALLNHSLSLASGRGETSLDLYVRGKDISPVDTPSKTHDRSSSPDSTGTPCASSPATAASPAAQSCLQQASSVSSQSSRTPTIPSAGMAASPIALNHLQQFRIKRHSSQPDLTAAKRLKLGQMLSEWGFNALALDAEDLFEASSLMFEAVLRMEGVDTGVPLGKRQDYIHPCLLR